MLGGYCAGLGSIQAVKEVAAITTAASINESFIFSVSYRKNYIINIVLLNRHLYLVFISERLVFNTRIKIYCPADSEKPEI